MAMAGRGRGQIMLQGGRIMLKEDEEATKSQKKIGRGRGCIGVGSQAVHPTAPTVPLQFQDVKPEEDEEEDDVRPFVAMSDNIEHMQLYDKPARRVKGMCTVIGWRNCFEFTVIMHTPAYERINVRIEGIPLTKLSRSSTFAGDFLRDPWLLQPRMRACPMYADILVYDSPTFKDHTTTTKIMDEKMAAELGMRKEEGRRIPTKDYQYHAGKLYFLEPRLQVLNEDLRAFFQNKQWVRQKEIEYGCYEEPEKLGLDEYYQDQRSDATTVPVSVVYVDDQELDQESNKSNVGQWIPVPGYEKEFPTASIPGQQQQLARAASLFANAMESGPFNVVAGDIVEKDPLHYMYLCASFVCQMSAPDAP